VSFRRPTPFEWIPWTALASVWVLSFFYTVTPLQDTVWCIWRRVVGLRCPGCGLTSAFVDMSAGVWGSAFSHNWAGPTLYLAMVWCVVVWALRLASDGPGSWTLPKWALVGFWSTTGLLFVGQAVRTVYGWFNL
jgi:hypothetical protein